MYKKMGKKILDFTKHKPIIGVPDLLEMQRASFEAFLQNGAPPEKRKNEGLQELFKNTFPVKSYNGKLVLEFVEYRFDEPRHSMKECEEQGLPFSLPMYVKFRLIKRETGEVAEQEVYLGNLPLMGERGSFIINGAERVIVNQLQRSPGVFFEESSSGSSGHKLLYRARIVPEQGSWLDFEVKDNLLYIRINRGRRILATLFLRVFGISPEEVLEQFPDPGDKKILEDTFKRDGVSSQEEAVLKIYQRIRPGRPPIPELASDTFIKTFRDPRRYNLGRVGRFQLN
ncbi:MAG: DNA-directed RNA polymerase subunit beta, partial [Candidatus Aerophobetes bacterium]|nr:DNA-directed RNA polymerase subunit beta [Candidatus Aerophobetes bacterium]